MNYELKIDNAYEANGTVDLQRLATIANSIRKISEGSLQIRLRGVSLTKGRKKISLENALKVSLTGIKKGSTVLCLESEKFKNTLEPYQMDIFRQGAQNQLPLQTPVSLFISAFQQAISESDDVDLLDKPLLRELNKFKKAFLHDDEVFVISNQHSVSVLELKKDDFEKIKVLENATPDPEPVILNGIVDELKYSKLKIKIQTAGGTVDGFLSENLSSEEVATYWGKEITIAGTSHFKPGGKAIIEVERIFEPGKDDSYFSKKPKSETVEQQIQRQLNEKKFSNPLSKVVGKWPGNEDYYELLNMLTK